LTEEAAVDFAYDERTQDLMARLQAFLTEQVYPAEPLLAEQVAAARGTDREWSRPPVVEALKRAAREWGLWNLFLPGERGAGLTTTQYAPLAELTGRSPWLAPEALNCAAPDTGNMEVLAQFGTDEQQRRWLDPLLDGRIRSAFAMTEPDVASSDATNIRTSIRRDGDAYVVHGRKWWSTGAMDPNARVFIVMGQSADPDDASVPRHRRQSMILVPRDAPGVRVVRPLHTFGYDDAPHGGHAEVEFDHVRVPASNMLAGEGEGFAIAQARLGPGRIHHCMRLIGMAERAFELMCRRANERSAFGKPLARQGVVREQVANARIAIEQARLLVLKTAWLMDTAGNRAAHTEIQAIKVAVPAMVQRVIDDAIEIHGGAGVSQDTPLAQLWVAARTLRLADGPDEVHRMSLGRRELARYA
jgi:acyl-CoA dehydrogenase